VLFDLRLLISRIAKFVNLCRERLVCAETSEVVFGFGMAMQEGLIRNSAKLKVRVGIRRLGAMRSP
jgi:hypothetical protein